MPVKIININRGRVDSNRKHGRKDPVIVVMVILFTLLAVAGLFIVLKDLFLATLGSG